MLFEMRKCENICAFYLFYIVQWVLTSDLYCTAPFNNMQTLVNQWFTVMLPSIIIAYLSGNRLTVYFVGHICGYWSILFLFFQGLLVVVNIVIDSSQKHICYIKFWTSESVCYWKA